MENSFQKELEIFWKFQPFCYIEHKGSSQNCQNINFIVNEAEKKTMNPGNFLFNLVIVEYTGWTTKRVNIWPLFHCNKGQTLTLFLVHPVVCSINAQRELKNGQKTQIELKNYQKNLKLS